MLGIQKPRDISVNITAQASSYALTLHTSHHITFALAFSRSSINLLLILTAATSNLDSYATSARERHTIHPLSDTYDPPLSLSTSPLATCCLLPAAVTILVLTCGLLFGLSRYILTVSVDKVSSDMADTQRTPFPKEEEEFKNDPRIYFDKVENLYVLAEENGKEYEWNSKYSSWVEKVGCLSFRSIMLCEAPQVRCLVDARRRII